MPTTPPIQVYFPPLDGVAGHTEYIDTITNPSYTPASPPPGLDPQADRKFRLDQIISNFTWSHFIVVKPPYTLELTYDAPLPDIQPTRPETWGADAWNSRKVYGNGGKYHMFFHSGDHTIDLNPPFFLKVSDEPRDGKLVYEDTGRETPELKKESNGLMECVVGGMRREIAIHD